MSKTISYPVIDALQPGQVVRDKTLKGFGVRRQRDGAYYFVQSRLNGRMRWFTIGRHGSPWTPKEARDTAKQFLHFIQQGKDPRKQIAIHKDLKEHFPETFSRFLAAQSVKLKPRTISNYQQLADCHLIPFFKTFRLVDITPADVTKFHNGLSSTPSTANHAIALLKTIIYWGADLRAGLPNPCIDIDKFKEGNRAMFLKEEDVFRLADAIKSALQTQHVTVFGAGALCLFLFTGARKNEILSLKREYVDRQRMVAYLPDSKTGKKVLHLNRQAIAVLDSLPEVAGNPYYIVGRKPGTHMVELAKPWNHIRKLAGIPKFRIHDFRHSFASFAADQGASAKAVGRLLGHASLASTDLYIHLFSERADTAANATADRISSLLSPPANPQQPNRASDAATNRSNPQDHKSLENTYLDLYE